MIKAKEGLSDQIRAFMANTVEYIGRDFEELIDGIRVPDLRTKLEGKHALVIARGYRHHEDLLALRAYIREFKPVMVAVDGGADALLDAGYRPDLIVGDMDSVTDRALTCGAEVVVHAYPDGTAPGLARVQALGLDSVLLPGHRDQRGRRAAALRRGRSGADRRGRHAVHAGRVPGQGPAGMASAILTRMRVGDKIVEPKGVSRLYHSRVSTSWLVVLVLAAVATIAVAMWFLPVGHIIITYVDLRLTLIWHRLTGLFK